MIWLSGIARQLASCNRTFEAPRVAQGGQGLEDARLTKPAQKAGLVRREGKRRETMGVPTKSAH